MEEKDFKDGISYAINFGNEVSLVVSKPSNYKDVIGFAILDEKEKEKTITVTHLSIEETEYLISVLTSLIKK